MQDAPDTLHAAEDLAAPSSAADEWGWYLYGIIRDHPQAAERAADGINFSGSVELEGHQRVETITGGELIAVVRRVPLAEFAPEALRAQADNPAWLETVARQHNAVIEALHRTQSILPARFGSVYPSADDVRAALIEEQDVLLTRIARIEGCDEWGIRLYGDLATIQQRADEEQEGMRRLREDLASASPGRAYFLQRKLAEERAGAIERFVDELVDEAYSHFARHAKAGQVTRRFSSSRSTQDQQSAELSRVTFLVPRQSTEAFIADVRQFVESQAGLRCESSGPWPPYSFAAQAEES